MFVLICMSRSVAAFAHRRQVIVDTGEIRRVTGFKTKDRGQEIGSRDERQIGDLELQETSIKAQDSRGGIGTGDKM
jgi:hypothetical protein